MVIAGSMIPFLLIAAAPQVQAYPTSGITPFGIFPPECIHGLPNHSIYFSSNRTAIFPNGTRVTFLSLPECAKGQSAGSLPSTNGWVEDANWNDANQITRFTGQWRVPSAPSYYPLINPQTIFLFIGIEPSNGAEIIQPVLQYGRSSAGGGNYWSATSWFCCNPTVYNSLILPSSGDYMNGTITYQGGGGWNVNIVDVTSSSSSGVTYSSSLTYTAAYVTLEVYNVSQCNEYPASSPATFAPMYLKDSTGSRTPNWNTAINVNDGCGEGVSVLSAWAVQLSY
jgi:hypothetical protein